MRHLRTTSLSKVRIGWFYWEGHYRQGFMSLGLNRPPVGSVPRD